MATEKLIVKNFGPIREAELDLRKVTVLIGEQASGKSVLAKIIEMLHNRILLTYLLEGNDNIKLLFAAQGYGELLKYADINAIIKYKNPDFLLNIDWIKGKTETTFNNDVLQLLINESANLEDLEVALLVEESDSFGYNNFEKAAMLKASRESVHTRQEKNWNEITKILKESLYIPAERSLVFFSAKNNSYPQYINNFFTSFDYKKSLKPNFSILPNKFEYAFKKSENRNIIIENGKEFDIQSAASGIQSLVPIKVVVEGTNPVVPTFFIIEEPELNLYPTAQKKLVEYLIEKCTKGDNRLIITTHSPYILTALNNCIQAHNVGKLHPEAIDKVNKLVPPQYQIAYEDVSAYYVGGGTVKSIMNEEFQMIDANALDDVSNDLGAVFDKLLDLKYQKQD